VELLPLWLAPNMVTLLGFFFILSNVICLVIWMPDLVGPVGLMRNGNDGAVTNILVSRALHGYTTALPSVSGCIQLWITWMENKREGLAHPVDSGNYSIMVSIP